MKRAIFGSLVAASLGLCLGLFAWASDAEESEKKNLDDIRIENEGYERDIKGHVPFSHLAHAKDYGISCWNCHHVYEDGELVADESSEDQRCSDCHGLKATDDQPALIKAFHANCKGCHQEQGRGPIMCGECHIK